MRSLRPPVRLREGPGGGNRLACDDLPSSAPRRSWFGEIPARRQLDPGFRGQLAFRDRAHACVRHRAGAPLRFRRDCHGPARHRRGRNTDGNLQASGWRSAHNGDRLGRRTLRAHGGRRIRHCRPDSAGHLPDRRGRQPVAMAGALLHRGRSAVHLRWSGCCRGVAPQPGKGAGATYGASLAGSAAGAALALPLLAQVGSAATILLAAALGVAAPVVAAPRLAAIGAGLASIALVVGAIVIAPAGPRVSIHSQLAQALQRPDTRRLDTKLSANSRVDILQERRVSHDHRPQPELRRTHPQAPHRRDGRRRKRGGAGRPRCRGPGPRSACPRHRHTTRRTRPCYSIQSARSTPLSSCAPASTKSTSSNPTPPCAKPGTTLATPQC